MIQLHHPVRNQTVYSLVAEVIETLEQTFSQRILGYYLTGSAVTETMVAGSDLDVIVVFSGDFIGNEAAACRELGKMWLPKPAYELDLEPACEADLLREGATGLKLTAVFLYGTDIREQVPWEPLANFRRDVAAGFVEYASDLCDGAPLAFPLSYPDAQHPFWGYAQTDTRLVLKTILIGATLRVLLETGVRCGSKADAIVKYRQYIGDHWSEWLANLHQMCKLTWGYQIPTASAEREQLRQLLQPVLEFENEMGFLAKDWLNL